MIKQWFHGSPVKGIKSFDTEKQRYEPLEGQGVYLTQNYAIAREYAGSEGSVYVVDLNGAILNVTDLEEIHLIISKASKVAQIDILKLEYIQETIDGILNGQYQISNHKGVGLAWQIKNLLMNDENFITQQGSDERALQVETLINEYLLEHDAWLYQDTKLGLVMVVKNAEKVIPSKEIEIGSKEDLELI